MAILPNAPRDSVQPTSAYALSPVLKSSIHLQATAKVTVKTIAVGSDRNIKIELFIGRVREGLANNPSESTSPQNHTPPPIGDSILRTQIGDPFCAFEPELVIGQQVVIFL